MGEVGVEGLEFGVRSTGVEEVDQGHSATSQVGVPVFSQPVCDDFASGGLRERLLDGFHKHRQALTVLWFGY